MQIASIYFLWSIVFIICSTSWGDTSLYSPPNETTKFNVGALECVQLRKRTSDQIVLSAASLKCTRLGKQLFEIANYGATEIIADRDSRYILGLSNSGRDEYAFWLLNESGKVLTKVKHGDRRLSYCRATVSAIREWVAAPSNARFQIENKKLLEIIVRLCSGKEINLSSLAKIKTF